MSVSQTYRYEPLEDPSQQIRLLQLNATRDNRAVLTGRLSVYNIPSQGATRLARLSKHLQLPGYFAISYVWGTGSDLNLSHEIILDNRRFPITANLHAALHKYRSSWVASGRYWVDAICINQADNDEKSAQVPLMRDIYHLAMSVHI
ncbi:heterokaryon incompatibility protein-domain-containing protein, partial [Bisporella sp. PMI_857]